MHPTPTTLLSTFLLLLLLTTTHSHPLYILPAELNPNAAPTPPPTTLTAAQILQIAPKSSTCANAPYPDECRTADQAAQALDASFQTYGITSAGERAALLSLIAFETDDFRYNKNHTPGRPGQGSTSPPFPFPFPFPTP